MPNVQANGINIHYEIIGEGEPLLCLHGMGCGWKMCEPQIEPFSKQYQLILVDAGAGRAEQEGRI